MLKIFNSKEKNVRSQSRRILSEFKKENFLSLSFLCLAFHNSFFPDFLHFNFGNLCFTFSTKSRTF